jgi:hypothetical protein
LPDLTIDRNLQDIIALKKACPEKVLLLLGNHDVQYMFYPHFRSSGFRDRQIKEKFGGLCFYTNALPEGGIDIIIRYMKLSKHTCEICGSRKNVKVRGKRWIKTLCDEHAHFAKN